jgi:hypothetical protein
LFKDTVTASAEAPAESFTAYYWNCYREMCLSNVNFTDR